MCWFYMVITQIALHPPPSDKRANVEEKVLQTILTSTYTPGQTPEKKCFKPSHQQAFNPTPLSGNAHMETTHFEKGFPQSGADFLEISNIRSSFPNTSDLSILVHCHIIGPVKNTPKSTQIPDVITKIDQNGPKSAQISRSLS